MQLTLFVVVIDDLEGACRMLIPIIYNGGDDDEHYIDPETMLRRTPLDELYRYLKQHYDYRRDVRHDLTEAEQQIVEASSAVTASISTQSRPQTSLVDLYRQRSASLEPFVHANDDSHTSIIIDDESDMRGVDQSMGESGVSYQEYELGESVEFEETIHDDDVDVDDSVTAEWIDEAELRHEAMGGDEDNDQMVEETKRDEDDESYGHEQTLSSELESVSAGSTTAETTGAAGNTAETTGAAGDTAETAEAAGNTAKTRGVAGNKVELPGEPMQGSAARENRRSIDTTESFAFTNLQSRWTTLAVSTNGNYQVARSGTKSEEQKTPNHESKLKNDGLISTHTPKSMQDLNTNRTMTEVEPTIPGSRQSITKSDIMGSHSAANAANDTESLIVQNEGLQLDASQARGGDEEFAFTNLRSKWKSVAGDSKDTTVATREVKVGVTEPTKPVESSKVSLTSIRSTWGKTPTPVYTSAKLVARKSNKGIGSLRPTFAEKVESEDLRPPTPPLASRGKADETMVEASRLACARSVANWKGRQVPLAEDPDAPSRFPPAQPPSRTQHIEKSQPGMSTVPWKLYRAIPFGDIGEKESIGPTVSPRVKNKWSGAGVATVATLQSSLDPPSSRPNSIRKPRQASLLQTEQASKSLFKMDAPNNTVVSGEKSRWEVTERKVPSRVPSAKPVAIWKASRAAAMQDAGEGSDQPHAIGIRGRWCGPTTSGRKAVACQSVPTPKRSLVKADENEPPFMSTPSQAGSWKATGVSAGYPSLSPVSTVKAKWSAPPTSNIFPASTISKTDVIPSATVLWKTSRAPADNVNTSSIAKVKTKWLPPATSNTRISTLSTTGSIPSAAAMWKASQVAADKAIESPVSKLKAKWSPSTTSSTPLASTNAKTGSTPSAAVMWKHSQAVIDSVSTSPLPTPKPKWSHSTAIIASPVSPVSRKWKPTSKDSGEASILEQHDQPTSTKGQPSKWTISPQGNVGKKPLVHPASKSFVPSVGGSSIALVHARQQAGTFGQSSGGDKPSVQDKRSAFLASAKAGGHPEKLLSQTFHGVGFKGGPLTKPLTASSTSGSRFHPSGAVDKPISARIEKPQENLLSKTFHGFGSGGDQTAWEDHNKNKSIFSRRPCIQHTPSKALNLSPQKLTPSVWIKDVVDNDTPLAASSMAGNNATTTKNCTSLVGPGSPPSQTQRAPLVSCPVTNEEQDPPKAPPTVFERWNLLSSEAPVATTAAAATAATMETARSQQDKASSMLDGSDPWTTTRVVIPSRHPRRPMSTAATTTGEESFAFSNLRSKFVGSGKVEG